MVSQNKRTASSPVYDAVVVGAGFAGLYMVHRLRQLGLSVIGLEAGESVGGTWYWNRYPGARCDIESVDYSYSFSDELQEKWTWTERFATQPEILRYLNFVADELDLRNAFQFKTRVRSATFEEERGVWEVTSDADEQWVARFCIMATGGLSAPKLPDIDGIETFSGRLIHTANWPQEGVDFSDRRVAVIGTGSTGVQAIPIIARECARLYVVQRTPCYSVPARNRPLEDAFINEVKAHYSERRARARQTQMGVLLRTTGKRALELTSDERERAYEEQWTHGGPGFQATFTDLFTDDGANQTAAQFVRDKIRAIVHDPAVADSLTPTGYPLAAKRICVDTDYYETFNRDNVQLIDLAREPLLRVEPSGLTTTSAHYDVDDIVLATGFDALTGALMAIDVRGSAGKSLREQWGAGPRTYLGLMTSDFPNLFIIAGPGSPSVLSNVVVSIEQHVEWISDCISWMEKQGFRRVEPSRVYEDNWVSHLNELADRTIFTKAASWYLGANVPGKPRVFMPYVGGVGRYRAICDEVARNEYRGFKFSA